MTINEAISHKELLNEIATLHNEALTRHLSQSELRIRFNQLKRINADLGQLQFDMMNDPVWEYLTVKTARRSSGTSTRPSSAWVGDSLRVWRRGR